MKKATLSGQGAWNKRAFMSSMAWLDSKLIVNSPWLSGVKVRSYSATFISAPAITIRLHHVSIPTWQSSPLTRKLQTTRLTFSIHLTGFSEYEDYNCLLVAPLNLRKRTLKLIQRETAHAKAGRPARIIAKINSLTDLALIRALYNASEAGVSIDLIVRGICMLRPGLPDVSCQHSRAEHRRTFPGTQQTVLFWKQWQRKKCS
jgi:hypothetical protein